MLLEELRSFKIIIDMVMKMTAPLLNQLASMYIVFYIFAQVGMSGLSGVVK